MTEARNEDREVANLQDGARYSYLAGTGMYLLSIYLAASTDLELIHAAPASGAPVEDATWLGAAVAMAWFGRRWRSDAAQMWLEASESAESTRQQG